MRTNLGLTKEEIIMNLLTSLNEGDTEYYARRVQMAITQYEELVENGIIVELYDPDGTAS